MKARHLIGLVALVAVIAAPAASADPVVVSGGIPPTLSLSLGTVPSLGTFIPGEAATYSTTATATATSTAGSAILTIADLSPIAPAGHLINGAYSLPSAVKASGTSSVAPPDAVGTPLSDVSATPLTLVTYSQPFSGDVISIGLAQPIAATDSLRSGTYSKVLTLTLSTTSP